MQVTESYENYLETIYILLKQQGEVHSVDIANYLSFSKPSVSVAMKKLRNEKYITMDGHGHIALTATGQKIAEEMYKRHTLISSWLVALGVDEKTATEDACRIEHVISKNSFDAVMRHVEGGKP